MSSSISPKPVECELYSPGHNVHWIHAQHWMSGKSIPASVLSVEDGWVHFTADRTLLTRWHHRAFEISEMLAANPRTTVTFSERWRILALEPGHSENSIKPFYLDVEPSACRCGLLKDLEPDAEG